MIRKWNNIDLRIPGIGSTSISGSSAVDTVLLSQSITANTFKVGDTIKIRASYAKGVTNSTNYTIRLHWNTAAHLTGATQLAQYNLVGSGDTSPSLYRVMTFKSSNQAIIASTGTSLTDDILVGSFSAETLSNINISAQAHIIASAERTSISRTNDTITCYYLSIEV